MSPALQAVVGLALVAAFVGGVWLGARTYRDQANHWLNRWCEAQQEADALRRRIVLPRLCDSCAADRAIRESGCTPPRAGVDA